MRAVPVAELPEGLRRAIGARDLIVFDGVCALCSASFRFVLRHDRAGRFSFATAQSSLGERLYAALGLPVGEYETNLVIVGGLIHTRTAAFAAVMRALGWPWRALAAVGAMPDWLADPAYDLVARNRYRLFGRHEACMIPAPEIRARFIDA